MSTRLREAAIQRLRSTGDGAVRRLSVEVEVDGKLETVIVSLRDAELQCVSSDGQNEGPHVIAALRFVAGPQTVDDSLAARPAVLLATKPEPRVPNELADALDDLLTAIIRVGVRGAQYAPSV
ncbi:MAG: hypothetical protein JSV06_05755, partial [Myxococcales bacterium]